jgi:mannose-6-phosphate isomerase-like protein (cupin superfamily)
MNHKSINEALAELEKIDSPFKKVFSHGSLEVEMYKPEGEDLQQPHTRDEVYIIAEGRGMFIHEGATQSVRKGDFLFVAAGEEHRFYDFTKDFCTWVLFYGPEGGE